jgi:hypothetical protein
MKKNEYRELQSKLEKAAINNDEQTLRNLLNDNKDLINRVVNDYGSGSAFLLTPYNILYSNHNYKTSGLYQDLIEEINPIALLGEDE